MTTDEKTPGPAECRSGEPCDGTDDGETDKLPLGSIALSLSGGRGRAAGFHLDTLAYLNRVDLLKDVSILSSVSGGSIVAAKYALTLKTAPGGEPLDDTFHRFHQEFLTFFKHVDLMWRVFKKLGARPEHQSSRKSGRQNATLAVADIYDESRDFLNGARFDVFWGRREIHIRELVINATEFKTGLAFRFHKGADERRSGNLFVPLPESWARKGEAGRYRRCVRLYPHRNGTDLFPSRLPLAGGRTEAM